MVKMYSPATACDDSGVSCPCCPPPASEYRRFFGRKIAGHEARRYRRKGLPKTARRLAAAVAGADSVLDIGGGVGGLSLELLARGAARATVVELSDGYEDAAAELLAEHRLGDRVVRRVGDFVAEAGLVEPHDAVLLHRVVCCYPDADTLVSTAAAHARRRLALTYPRERALTRAGFRMFNLYLRATRCGFRTFVHPFTAMEAAAERQGLALTTRERQGPIWENAVFERLADDGAGHPRGMEPRHREEEVEQIDSEREHEVERDDHPLEGDDEGDLAHRTPPDEDETQL
jgi:SAM-dependent methyltransferase